MQREGKKGQTVRDEATNNDAFVHFFGGLNDEGWC